MLNRMSGLAAVIVLTTAGLAGAETAPGDVAAGRALAEKTCVRCHDIEPGGASKMYPPSFTSIAGYRSPDLIRERIWWPSNHSSMPEGTWLFTVQDVTDLTAYIVSLEKQ